MTEFLLSQNMFPFSLALSLVLGLLFLEVVFLLLGGSLFTADSDAIDADFGEVDFDADGFEINASEVDLGASIDTDAADLGADGGEASIPITGWLGLGKVPLAIWMACVLTGFGLSGFILQSLSNALFGFSLPVMIAIPLALVPALAFVQIASGWLARLIPKTETSAVSLRSMGSQHGVITQGTARRGNPAEVRLKDRHGNSHYLRVEPFEDDAELPQGTEVYVIRKRDGTFRAMEISL